MNGRAEQLPFPDATFDALTFTYLLRYVDDPQATLAELARVVRPGGTVASLEFCVPPTRFWRSGGGCTPHPAAARRPAHRRPRVVRVGRFLGPSISGHYRRYPVRWTVQAWREAGVTDVGVRLMSLGGGLVMWGTQSRWLTAAGQAGLSTPPRSAGRWRDWWTLLHPPYTAWHLSYVVIGAALAPHVDLAPLLATLARVLPRRRARRARAGRAARPPAAHRDPSGRAHRGHGHRAWPARSPSASIGVTRVGWLAALS